MTYTCRTGTAGNKGTISIRFNLDAVPTAIYATGKSDSCGTGATAASKLLIAATTDNSAQFNYNAVIDTTGTNEANCGVTGTGVRKKAFFPMDYSRVLWWRL